MAYVSEAMGYGLPLGGLKAAIHTGSPKTDRGQVDFSCQTLIPRTTRMSAASSWLNLDGDFPPIRTNNEVFLVPGETSKAVPGTKPRRFISRSAVESRSETLLITAGTPQGHFDRATSSRTATMPPFSGMMCPCGSTSGSPSLAAIRSSKRSEM